MKLQVRVPATTSNVGPGFDCFGMALGLYLTVTLEPAKTHRVTSDSAGIPLDASNLVRVTFLQALGKEAPAGVALHLENDIPLARGLGSSAAARVAGLALADAWRRGDASVDRAWIHEAAVALEHHPDNATPAVYGGFCICAGTQFERIEMVTRRYLVVVPELEIHTEAARAALPRQRSLEDCVFNLQRAALSAARVARTGDLSGAAPFEDCLHQRYRLALDDRLGRAFETIRGLASVASVFLSGSGPTVFVLPSDEEEASLECTAAFARVGVAAQIHALVPDSEGLRISVR